MLRELRQAVRQGQVSPSDLVSRAVTRISEHNPSINAVVVMRETEALAEAKALERLIAGGSDPGPLAGIPVLVKDTEDVEGLRTTHGSLVRRDAPLADKDGIVPRRLKAAGAIVIGKTNTPEFAAEAFTANRLFGVTRNPWALDWSPGGSSGGSGAAMAAGLAPIATGTDGGGSTRFPAAWCGLVGIKPTNGVIGRDPIPPWIDVLMNAPLGHSIDDLRILLSVEAGPVVGDPTALPHWELGPGGRPGRVLAAPRFTESGPLPNGIDDLFKAALAKVESDLGFPVQLVKPETIFAEGDPGRDWELICGPEQAHELGGLLTDGPDSHLLTPRFQQWMHDALRVAVEDHLAARRRRFSYVRDLDLLLGADSILLTPTVATEGLYADGRFPGCDSVGEYPPEWEAAANTYQLNLTGHPALSVPAGLSTNGVPFGLQIIGPRFRDDLVLDFGARWEEACPWPVVAAGYEPFWN
jgi:Asp-tRNA(Asn)/Glu-tRNA(Gln) amidotransferase A subunit family amidase